MPLGVEVRGGHVVIGALPGTVARSYYLLWTAKGPGKHPWGTGTHRQVPGSRTPFQRRPLFSTAAQERHDAMRLRESRLNSSKVRRGDAFKPGPLQGRRQDCPLPLRSPPKAESGDTSPDFRFVPSRSKERTKLTPEYEAVFCVPIWDAAICSRKGRVQVLSRLGGFGMPATALNRQ